MTDLNFPAQVQELIDSKQLIELYFSGLPQKVAYIINMNEDFITFAELSPSASLSQVAISRKEDLTSLKTNTIYLAEFGKQIEDNSLLESAMEKISQVTEFTFEGFMASLEKTKTIAEFTIGEESIAGRVAEHINSMIVIDEFYAEYNQRFAHSYFLVSNITKIALGVPWIKTITRSVEAKNL